MHPAVLIGDSHACVTKTRDLVAQCPRAHAQKLGSLLAATAALMQRIDDELLLDAA